jgi:uncharacterized repeat protein (TIGR01451 family)
VTIAAAPAITVTKTADVRNAEVGEEITYTYHITNTGNITLTSVSARDDLLGTINVSSTLAMSESMMITETYIVTEDDLPGPIINTIAVSGTWSYAGDTGMVSASDTASVILSQAPVAEDDTASTTQDTPVNIDVLDNDNDPDGDPLTVVDVGDPTDGTATTDGNQVTYTPTAAFTGTTTFTYTISDGSLTDSATVTVIIGSADDTTPPEPPVIGDGTGMMSTMDNTPVFNGTAEPGSLITLTLTLSNSTRLTYQTAVDDDGHTLVYETTAGANGDWAVDTETNTPVSGTMPEGGLPPEQYNVTVTATDPAGNMSNPAAFRLVITSSADTPKLYLPLIIR